MEKDSLGTRMKMLESKSAYRLETKKPVIARIDGKAFHSFTKGMDRPWDIDLQQSMAATAKYLCENIQGAKLAYTQSDEISILLTDYERSTTQAWFDYKLQKMSSVAASFATSSFMIEIMKRFPDRIGSFSSKDRLPAFDARFFNLEKNEVCNYFWWRQQDAIRNSIQMLTRTHFSHSECKNKNQNELKEMLLSKNISWDDQDHFSKYGTCIIEKTISEDVSFEIKGEKRQLTVDRCYWSVDLNIPLFKTDRAYINGRLGEDYVETKQNFVDHPLDASVAI